MFLLSTSAVVVRGDARALLLPDESVDLVVTSPPYFGLRSYTDGGEHYSGQIGAEPTPAEYVAALLECTREWMRILKPEGSIWVNLGDKYAGGGGQWDKDDRDRALNGKRTSSRNVNTGGKTYGLRAKSLIGLPWRYTLGCIDDLGLILRAEVIWSKPNGLPESVKDRVRRSHETWFHLVKSPRYFSALDEIREPHISDPRDCARLTPNQSRPDGHYTVRTNHGGHMMGTPHALGKLPGSVWEIATQPLKVPAELAVDHFAAFPMEWPRRLILGWSPSGICTACGEGRRPVAAVDAAVTKDWALNQRGGRAWHGDGDSPTRALGTPAADRNRRITGCACACPDTTAPTRPAVVLDPFGGTGTVALVASVLGRRGISIDMSADYCRIAEWRVNDPRQRERALKRPAKRAAPETAGWAA